MTQREELRLLRYYARVGAIDYGWMRFGTDPKSRAVQRGWIAEGLAEQQGDRWRFKPREIPPAPDPEDRTPEAIEQRLDEVLTRAIESMRARLPGIVKQASNAANDGGPFLLPKGLLVALLRAEAKGWGWEQLPLSIRRACNKAEWASSLFDAAKGDAS